MMSLMLPQNLLMGLMAMTTPMQQREAILRAMKAVKEVIPCDGPSSYLPLVQEHKPGFFIHGDDWKVSGGHVEIGECEVD